MPGRRRALRNDSDLLLRTEMHTHPILQHFLETPACGFPFKSLVAEKGENWAVMRMNQTEKKGLRTRRDMG